MHSLYNILQYSFLILFIGTTVRSEQVKNTPAVVLQNLTVDGKALVSSYNYPGLLITSLDKNPDYYDWALTPKTIGNGLLLFFDRVDYVQEGYYNYKEEQSTETAYLCSQDQYEQCAKPAVNESDCDYCDEIISPHSMFDMKWDDMPQYIVFRPIIPTLSDYPTLARAGYRATVVDYDQLNRRFFECDSTVDITNATGPVFLISQNYPRNTQMFRECHVRVKSNDGIRVKIPQIRLLPKDTLEIQGRTPDGQQINYNVSDPDEGFLYETFHFVNEVNFTIHMSQATLNQKNYFAIQTEYMILSPTAETQVNVNLTAGHYSFQSQGYGNTTYPNNVKTTYNFQIPLNHQFDLFVIDFDLEEFVDYFDSNLTGRITGSFQNSRYYADVNTTSAGFVLETDDIEALRGFNIDINTLDCDCGETNIKVPANFSRTFTMPVNPKQTAYCRGLTCVYSLIPDPELYLEVEFTKVDIDYIDSLTIQVNGYPDIPYINTTTVFFNVGTFINFTSNFVPYEYGHSGYSFTVRSVKPTTQVIDICNEPITVIKEIISPGLNEVKQYRIKNCKGHLGVQVLNGALYDVELYDGTFSDQKLNVTSEVIVASGQEMSIRLQSEFLNEEEFVLVLSNAFTDENGNICGGQTNTTIQYTSDGCIQFYYDYVFTYLLDGPPLKIYRGLSVNKIDLIPGSGDAPLRLYTVEAVNPISFIVPKGYPGATLVLPGSYYEFPAPENGSILIASGHFFHWDCGFGKCELSGSLINNGNTTRNIQFELLETLGTATLNLNGNFYNGCNGLLNLVVPPNTTIQYTNGTSNSEYLLAKVSLTDAQPTDVNSTTTPFCSTTSTTTLATTSTKTTLTTAKTSAKTSATQPPTSIINTVLPKSTTVTSTATTTVAVTVTTPATCAPQLTTPKHSSSIIVSLSYLLPVIVYMFSSCQK